MVFPKLHSTSLLLLATNSYLSPNLSSSTFLHVLLLVYYNATGLFLPLMLYFLVHTPFPSLTPSLFLFSTLPLLIPLLLSFLSLLLLLTTSLFLPLVIFIFSNISILGPFITISDKLCS